MATDDDDDDNDDYDDYDFYGTSERKRCVPLPPFPIQLVICRPVLLPYTPRGVAERVTGRDIV